MREIVAWKHALKGNTVRIRGQLTLLYLANCFGKSHWAKAWEGAKRCLKP